MRSSKTRWHGNTAVSTFTAAPPFGPTPEAIEDLARYIVRTCFSQERMIYIPAVDTTDGLAKVIYSSKDRREYQTLKALDWLAQLVTHIPNQGEQMVRDYGYYSNKARGMRQKAECDNDTPALAESSLSSTARRKNWARLIQKIYEVDPLLCPKCHGAMRIIAFIAFIEEQAGDPKNPVAFRAVGDTKSRPAQGPCRSHTHL